MSCKHVSLELRPKTSETISSAWNEGRLFQTVGLQHENRRAAMFVDEDLFTYLGLLCFCLVMQPKTEGDRHWAPWCIPTHSERALAERCENNTRATSSWALRLTDGDCHRPKKTTLTLTVADRSRPLLIDRAWETAGPHTATPRGTETAAWVGDHAATRSPGLQVHLRPPGVPVPRAHRDDWGSVMVPSKKVDYWKASASKIRSLQCTVCQSARMSKITNDLTHYSGTGCFI